MQVYLVIQAKLDGRTVPLLVFQIAQIELTVEFDKVACFVKTKPLLLTILFNDRGQLDVDGCNFLDPSHPLSLLSSQLYLKVLKKVTV